MGSIFFGSYPKSCDQAPFGVVELKFAFSCVPEPDRVM